MAGGHMKHRHLGVTSSHRQALLRNMVTSLFIHESITTTYAKAKEAQRLAEKVVTLAKKNTEASKIRAQSILYTPHDILPKLFGPIRERYLNRPGGYTRVLRVEPEKPDSAPSAILELVDGPRDMRFAMVAKTLARVETIGQDVNELTQKNVRKVTRYREAGQEELEDLVDAMKEKKDDLFVKRNVDGVGEAKGEVQEKYQWQKVWDKHGKPKVFTGARKLPG